MCEINEGSVYADYKDSYFTATLKRSQAFVRLRTGRNIFFFLLQALHRMTKIFEFKCVTLSFSVVVYGGVHAHARNGMSLYFPRLYAPLWFR